MTNYKIVLYGDYGVGKTCLTERLLRKNFNKQPCATIGAAFSIWKDPALEKISFELWDTAGQERFLSLLPIYLRNADAVFYCYDYTQNFDSVKADKMHDNVMHNSPKCHFYLVMTKIDMTKNTVWAPLAEKWAIDRNVKGCYYTSSLTGVGVQDLFSQAALSLVANPPYEKIEQIDEPLLTSKRCCN